MRKRRGYALHKPSGEFYVWHTRSSMRATLAASLAAPIAMLPGRLIYHLLVAPRNFFKDENVSWAWKNRKLFTLTGMVLDRTVSRAASVARGFFLRVAIGAVALWGTIAPYRNAPLDARRAIGVIERSVNDGVDWEESKVDPLIELITSESFYLHSCCQKEKAERITAVKKDYEVVTIEGRSVSPKPKEPAHQAQ